MLDELLTHAVEKLEAARESSGSQCKICGGEAFPFDVVDFSKSCHAELYPSGLSAIPVMYWQCKQCQFVFTDFFDGFTPEQWQRYVYNDEYAKVDPDYNVNRPRSNVRFLSTFLSGRKNSIVCLDYGGGNGLTAELMSKAGWAFDCFDPFGHISISPERLGRYNFCSAIEVFEHSPDPAGSLRAIVEKASAGQLMILIATELTDGVVSSSTRLSWWYAAPRNGHVSLYSRKSLQILGSMFGLDFSTMRGGPILLTRGFDQRQVHLMLLRDKIVRQWIQSKILGRLRRLESKRPIPLPTP
jgi:hypothetical protein